MSKDYSKPRKWTNAPLALPVTEEEQSAVMFASHLAGGWPCERAAIRYSLECCPHSISHLPPPPSPLLSALSWVHRFLPLEPLPPNIPLPRLSCGAHETSTLVPTLTPRPNREEERGRREDSKRHSSSAAPANVQVKAQGWVGEWGWGGGGGRSKMMGSEWTEALEGRQRRMCERGEGREGGQKHKVECAGAEERDNRGRTMAA